jgi:hypothetical protein
LYALGYDLSVAVAVGFIALAGVAAETGVVMIIYLEQAWATRRARAQARGTRRRRRVNCASHRRRALLRLRPKLMTVITIIVGLLPIMWGRERGERHASHRGADGRRNGFGDRADARDHPGAVPARSTEDLVRDKSRTGLNPDSDAAQAQRVADHRH